MRLDADQRISSTAANPRQAANTVSVRMVSDQRIVSGSTAKNDGGAERCRPADGGPDAKIQSQCQRTRQQQLGDGDRAGGASADEVDARKKERVTDRVEQFPRPVSVPACRPGRIGCPSQSVRSGRCRFAGQAAAAQKQAPQIPAGQQSAPQGKRLPANPVFVRGREHLAQLRPSPTESDSCAGWLVAPERDLQAVASCAQTASMLSAYRRLP